MLTPIVADYNTVIHGVPDDLALQLVRMGNAVILGEDGDPVPMDRMQQLTEEWAPVVAAGPDPRPEPEPVYSSLTDENPTQMSLKVPDTTEPQEMKCPYGNASKPAWVKWALYSDPELTEEAAMEMSKNQLQATYGERL
jgi:hypothetical protein